MTKELDSKKQPDQVGILVELLKVATRISRPMRDDVADPEEVSVRELRILLVLGGEGPLAGIDIAELILMQPMNVSRALKSLEDMKLIEVADNQNNRRRKPYQLTKSGYKKYEAMHDRMLHVSQFLFEKFSEPDVRRIAKLLSKLDDRLIEWQTPPDLKHVPRA